MAGGERGGAGDGGLNEHVQDMVWLVEKEEGLVMEGTE